MNKMRGLREHAAKQKRKLDWNTKNIKQKQNMEPMDHVMKDESLLE
jgi:hypothetical protein